MHLHFANLSRRIDRKIIDWCPNVFYRRQTPRTLCGIPGKPIRQLTALAIRNFPGSILGPREEERFKRRPYVLIILKFTRRH